mmetsp:Transcript_23943/g.32936  ORF Transcript_23943/g.32936 Transcript_23943/m.32936 type:complete len:361 (-) Transcript_23943:45-1127(-)|eukprot:CAMPEP_0196575536 /NCGR_PEP_ID=MMETSP1081-20130531/4995_1 /TAXON_ID=36882 /ORGANISM="Pyramimonas amylifera, Strain CCMP720" /LENGTH=360 /DNA_ID=CAMNT_0041893871 /DNA_START=94 /DNA_END=1176 /DNA_ORIENTATION=+
MASVHSAAKRGYLNIIRRQLLERPDIDLNALDERSCTLLHIASREGHAQIVEYLLQLKDSGFNVDIQLTDQDGQTALQLAEKSGHQAIVKLLGDFNKQSDTIPHELISAKNTLIHLQATLATKDEELQLLQQKLEETNMENERVVKELQESVAAMEEREKASAVLIKDSEMTKHRLKIDVESRCRLVEELRATKEELSQAQTLLGHANDSISVKSKEEFAFREEKTAMQLEISTMKGLLQEYELTLGSHENQKSETSNTDEEHDLIIKTLTNKVNKSEEQLEKLKNELSRTKEKEKGLFETMVEVNNAKISMEKELCERKQKEETLMADLEEMRDYALKLLGEVSGDDEVVENLDEIIKQ